MACYVESQAANYLPSQCYEKMNSLAYMQQDYISITNDLCNGVCGLLQVSVSHWG